MGRWEPNARGRLATAALELYRERGFDQTTVAEIAARAGLTERTFFRYFTDKREVLFGGTDVLRGIVVEALTAVPASAAPIDAAMAAVKAAGAMIEEHTGRERAHVRQAIVLAHPELRERELIKVASLAAVIAETLRHRGIEEPAASLVAEAAIAVFKIGFERWLEDEGRDFGQQIQASFDELKAAMMGKAGPSAPRTTARAEPPTPALTRGPRKARGGRTPK